MTTDLARSQSVTAPEQIDRAANDARHGPPAESAIRLAADTDREDRHLLFAAEDPGVAPQPDSTAGKLRAYRRLGKKAKVGARMVERIA